MISNSPARDGFTPIPSELADEYRAAGYWTGQSLGELLRSAARRWPDRPVLLDVAGARSYRELDAGADRMAYGILAAGIEPGDRVIVQLPNVPEFAVVLFGLLRAGVIPVLTLPAHRRAEIEHLAELSSAVDYLTVDRIGEFDCRELAAEMQDRLPELRHIFVLRSPYLNK